jgi:hypothetical protein
MAQDPNARALAVLRIGVGLFFLIFAHTKSSPPNSPSTAAFNSVRRLLTATP